MDNPNPYRDQHFELAKLYAVDRKSPPFNKDEKEYFLPILDRFRLGHPRSEASSQQLVQLGKREKVTFRSKRCLDSDEIDKSDRNA